MAELGSIGQIRVRELELASNEMPGELLYRSCGIQKSSYLLSTIWIGGRVTRCMCSRNPAALIDVFSMRESGGLPVQFIGVQQFGNSSSQLFICSVDPMDGIPLLLTKLRFKNSVETQHGMARQTHRKCIQAITVERQATSKSLIICWATVEMPFMSGHERHVPSKHRRWDRASRPSFVNRCRLVAAPTHDAQKTVNQRARIVR